MNKFTLIEWDTDKGWGDFKFSCQLDNNIAIMSIDGTEVSFDSVEQVMCIIDELVKLKWLLEDAKKETKISAEG